MPDIKANYVDVTPAAGLFVGSSAVFEVLFYSDEAKTTAIDPTTRSVVITHADDEADATTTPTSSATGTWRAVSTTVVSSGYTTCKWTVTDANGKTAVFYQYVRTSD